MTTIKKFAQFVVPVLIALVGNTLYAKNIVISFDGTENDPADGYDERELTEEEKENSKLFVTNDTVSNEPSISNVLKLHLLAGGKLDNSNDNNEQVAFYYCGIGNRYRTAFMRKIAAGLAIREPKVILKKARDDLSKHYEDGDKIYIFGFSRGAALARIFAQSLTKDGISVRSRKIFPSIEFMGVWDTVAALGGPDLNDRREPPPADVWESKGKIAANIKEAAHFLAIEEPRIAFRPTRMGKEDKVTEIWFAGVHSDVGGGYMDDSLSDITLQLMKTKAIDLGIKIYEIDEIAPNLGQVKVSNLKDDSNPAAPSHYKVLLDENRYKSWFDKLTNVLDSRSIQDDGYGDPILHESVIERLKKRPEECPRSLEQVYAYKLINSRWEISEPMSGQLCAAQ
jgi:hypothetical protein